MVAREWVARGGAPGRTGTENAAEGSLWYGFGNAQNLKSRRNHGRPRSYRRRAPAVATTIGDRSET
jgi:hypothetical protein